MTARKAEVVCRRHWKEKGAAHMRDIAISATVRSHLLHENRGQSPDKVPLSLCRQPQRSECTYVFLADTSRNPANPAVAGSHGLEDEEGVAKKVEARSDVVQNFRQRSLVVACRLKSLHGGVGGGCCEDGELEGDKRVAFLITRG